MNLKNYNPEFKERYRVSPKTTPTPNLNKQLFDCSEKGDDDCVKQLLKDGAYIHSTLKDDSTPLHIASKFGHIDVVNTLLDNGADVNAEMKNGETPLYVAAENGHNNIIHELMIDHSNLYQNIYPGKKLYKNTILMAAIIGKHIDTVNYLIQLIKKNENNNEINYNNYTLHDILTMKNEKKQTALILALKNGILKDMNIDEKYKLRTIITHNKNGGKKTKRRIQQRRTRKN